MAERVETRQEKKERKERERQEKEKQERERKEKEKQERERKERERQEKEKQERDRKERERLEKERKKKEEKEMKRRGDQWKPWGGGTTSPTGGRGEPLKVIHDVAMVKQPHEESHPVTDNRQQPSTTIITTTAGTNTAATAAITGSDHIKLTDDERGQMQAIKKSSLVSIKTNPSATDNTLMTEYNDEPIRAGAANITISPHVDQSMMMTGSYDRLEPHTDKVPSGSVTARPVTGPIHGHHLHTPHDDTASPQSLPDINSINTRLTIAEVQRDEYKKESDKKERELKQRQEEIVQLKVEIRKLQSNNPQTHLHSSHLINEKMREELEQKMREELEQKMREELAAKEQKMADELAAKEQKMADELAAKEQKMADELAAKEQEIDKLQRETETLTREKENLKREKDEITAAAADNVAAKEKEMAEKLTAKEEEMEEKLSAKEEEVTNLNQKLADKVEELKTLLSLDEKVKLLEVDNQQLKTQLDVVNAEMSLKKAEQNQNEKKEAELISELEKVNEEKKTKDARVKYLQGLLDKFNNETVPKLEQQLEEEKKKQEDLVKENKDLKRETDKNAIQAAEGVAGRDRETEELKKRLEEMEGEREETEAKLRETIDNLQHQLNEAIKAPPVEDGASANSSLTDEEKSKIILEMKEKEIKELTERIAILERGRGNDDDHAAVVAQLAEVDREKQEMENEGEKLKRQISISDRLVAENEEPKGRLLAYERDGQGSHQYGHESLGQQRGNLTTQIAKYKMKERELQEELMMKEKHMMELNEKLTKRNEIVTKLNDKLTKLNDENKRLRMSMVVQDEKSKANQVKAETDRDGVKQQVTDAYNEIKRLEEQIDQLNEQIKHLNDQLQVLTNELDGHNEVIETMKQERVSEKEALLATINSQTDDIKQHEADYDKLVGEMSHQLQLVEEKEQTIGALNKAIADNEKSIEVMNRQHQEKEKTIKTLMVSVEEKNRSIDELKQQVTKVHGKELALKELTEKLQIAQLQLQEYANGFNSERKDRERMSSELDEKKSQVLALQQSLHDETHKIKELEDKNRSLQQVVQQQKNELSVKDDAAKDWEEEKHMLTTQVNSYARQGDELKKSLTEQTDKCETLKEKCKTLDDQLMKKTEVANEVDKLKQELESELNSKQHFISAFNQEKVKVTVLEQEKMKLEGVVKTGLAEKAQLQQFIAQEQARMEEEMNKSRNANKVLREKLQAAEAQLAFAYQSQPHHRPSGSPHITPSGPPQGHIHQGGHAPHISERRNYPSTGNIGGYHQGTPAQATNNESHSHMIVSSAGQSDYHHHHHHNEQQQHHGDGDDMPPPQMNLQQMQQYSRHAQQQREQQQQRQHQQLEELYRVRGEEYRRRDEDLRRMQEEQEMRGAIADRELAELEELKREMAERKPVKPLPSYYKYSSRNEEMVISAINQPMNKEKKSDEIPENELLAGIDNEIQYYAEEVRRMSRPPNTAEVMREDDDSSLPYDPNLVCPKCGKQYRIGQIQYLRRHLEELCPLLKTDRL